MFQEDNDKYWFQNSNVEVLNWPAQPPTQNPIEKLWKIVKAAFRGKKPLNKEQLWKLINEMSKNISTEICQRLVDSMLKRCLAVINNYEGRSTKY